jgi:Ran GTPase-activating protein (RanGAP) involved in mRNA processing and transport
MELVETINSTLQAINLEGNYIGAEGAKAVAEVLKRST